MVFVNHLPQLEEQYRQRSERLRTDYTENNVLEGPCHRNGLVDGKSSSVIRSLVSLIHHFFACVSTSLRSDTTGILLVSSFLPFCPIYGGNSRLVSKSQPLFDYGSSKGFYILLLVLAFIIQTLQPRVEALELNVSSTHSPNSDDSSQSGGGAAFPSTAPQNAFNWSSGYFDPTFVPGRTLSTSSPG